MKILNMIIIIVIALLSIAAGIAKIMQTPQEMEFLQGVGLTPILIIAFGFIQLAGGVMLLPKKTRVIGAVLASVAFLISTILIFSAGNTAFGLVSLLPFALAVFILYRCASTKGTK